MSLKTRLVASIIALVAVIVVSLSGLYLRAVIENSFQDAKTVAELNAQWVFSYLTSRASGEAERMIPPPLTLDDVATAYVGIVESDLELPQLLETLMGNSPVIVEGLVTGPDNRILAASISSKRGQKHNDLPGFAEFERQTLWAQLDQVLSTNQDYEVVERLGIDDRELFKIRMIVSSVLLREEVMQRIEQLALVSVIALIASMFSAVIVSQLAVRPFERISDQIDRIAAGDAALIEGKSGGARELAVVQSKLNLLGERFRGARTDAQQLRGNIDQLLTRLEEAVLLFGRDDRLVMAGGSAERLIGGGRWEMMGKSLEDVLPDTTELGVFVQSAVQLRRNVKDRPVMYRISEDGGAAHLLVNVETVEEFPSRERIGTLVTLREAEPRLQIESQLDVSTRLAAISRLTSGAAHEIKNPLNSIALHLEVLRSKLENSDVGTAEIDVISREITRLDRVVKSFLDFTRPVELRVEWVDLGPLINEIASLVKPDAEGEGVQVACRIPDEAALVRADRDLLKQALLNVTVNGLQAMSEGGRLELGLEQAEGEWLVRIRDEGAGIPPEARDKIYQLYFTTKGRGSGIGLAMTFQVVQLHGGTIDFTSEVGKGTEFRIRLPAAQGSLPAPAAALTEDSPA